MAGFLDSFKFHMRILYGLIVVLFFIVMFDGERREKKEYSYMATDQRIEHLDEYISNGVTNKINDYIDNRIVHKIMPACFKGRE